MNPPRHLVVTCEHAGNLIPPAWRGLFGRYSRVLLSHQAFDAGALTLARELAQALPAELFFSKTSRLLIDLNRSLTHPQLFSNITRKLSATARQNIVNQYYAPYRAKIEHHIRDVIIRGEAVTHIASHSFTPELDGVVRDVDIGILYDPSRRQELALATVWQTALAARVPDLKIRRNAPYKGTSDGLTAALREVFDAPGYIGIELEVNQKHVFARDRHWPRLRVSIIQSLQHALHTTLTKA